MFRYTQSLKKKTRLNVFARRFVVFAYTFYAFFALLYAMPFQLCSFFFPVDSFHFSIFFLMLFHPLSPQYFVFEPSLKYPVFACANHWFALYAYGNKLTFVPYVAYSIKHHNSHLFAKS